MTVKEFDTLLQKAHYGHVVLEKYDDDKDDDGYFIHAFVADEKGDVIKGKIMARVVRGDKIVEINKHFEDIEIDLGGYQTFGEPDASDIEIASLAFHNKSWAYPSAPVGEPNCPDENCGITLNECTMIGNRPNAIDLYAGQALRMHIDPIGHQQWLLREFMYELDYFVENFLPTMESIGYTMVENNLYKRGGSEDFESVVSLEFTTGTAVSNFFISQNLFTGRFEFTKYYPREVSSDGGTAKDEIELRQISADELREYLVGMFETNGENFWREKAGIDLFKG